MTVYPLIGDYQFRTDFDLAEERFVSRYLDDLVLPADQIVERRPGRSIQRILDFQVSYDFQLGEYHVRDDRRRFVQEGTHSSLRLRQSGGFSVDLGKVRSFVGVRCGKMKSFRY